MGYPLLHAGQEHSLQLLLSERHRSHSAGVTAGGFRNCPCSDAVLCSAEGGCDAVESYPPKSQLSTAGDMRHGVAVAQAFSFTGFNEFNAGYIDVLNKWTALNPVARTDVVPAVIATWTRNALAADWNHQATLKSFWEICRIVGGMGCYREQSG